LHDLGLGSADLEARCGAQFCQGVDEVLQLVGAVGEQEEIVGVDECWQQAAAAAVGLLAPCG